MTHLTAHGEKALRQQRGATVRARVYFITLVLLGAVRSCEEDFLCELLFVGRKSNKSQRYSGSAS